ncbi:hypothetical protein M9H77_07005 [Catharanthus roseus]|uniref:Uncharacterized protein n=1 Tax=Catharanthus roseus TaxID=4058 RepID=A0ACC0BTP1_CATRO|nr:hypothetical protein M9H77_07005 [Catharanthus roseus]
MDIPRLQIAAHGEIDESGQITHINYIHADHSERPVPSWKIHSHPTAASERRKKHMNYQPMQVQHWQTGSPPFRRTAVMHKSWKSKPQNELKRNFFFEAFDTSSSRRRYRVLQALVNGNTWSPPFLCMEKHPHCSDPLSKGDEMANRKWTLISGLIDFEQRTWKQDLIILHFNSYEAEEILKVPICDDWPSDEQIWACNKIRWGPPDTNRFKLNVDTAWKLDGAGVGGLIRGHMGRLLCTYFSSPLTSELGTIITSSGTGVSITTTTTGKKTQKSIEEMALRGVWQLNKLIVSYCDWGGSSRGIRAFMESHLPAFREINPQLEVVTELNRGQHPYLKGLYSKISITIW